MSGGWVFLPSALEIPQKRLSRWEYIRGASATQYRQGKWGFVTRSQPLGWNLRDPCGRCPETTRSPRARAAGAEEGAHLLTEAGVEVPLHLRHSHPVLRPLGAADRCHDGAQVDPDHLGEERAKRRNQARRDGSQCKHYFLSKNKYTFVSF